MTTLLKKECKHFLAMVIILLFATVVSYGFMALQVQETNIVLVYVLAVLFIAWYTNSFIWGIAASVIGTAVFNFFFHAASVYALCI